MSWIVRSKVAFGRWREQEMKVFGHYDECVQLK